MDTPIAPESPVNPATAPIPAAEGQDCDHVMGYESVDYEGNWPVLQSEKRERPTLLTGHGDVTFTFCPDCGVRLLPPTQAT